MMATDVAAEIRRRLASLEPQMCELVDESARHAGHAGARAEGGTHWRLHIVSGQFAGKSTVARHRMVYAALGELINAPVHALAINARLPGEAEG